jgi:PIN domain nuclease of toxin-antitoxin system
MPKLLLDTHVFLWWVYDSPDLSKNARMTISDKDNDCYLSVASCWEMAIKSSLGKLKLTRPVQNFISDQLKDNDFTLLNIELHHVAKVEKLPYHHRDPFDRLLIAQALTENLSLVAADRAFWAYGIKPVW